MPNNSSNSSPEGRLYCAILGDIVASRKIPDRNAVQEQFNLVGCEINLLFENCVASNFTILRGDEFQVLLSTPNMAPEIIEFIRLKMFPSKFKIGVGFGLVNTAINKESTMSVDGPAFHRARAALDKAKKGKRAIVYNGDFAAVNLINSLYNFIEVCEQRRSPRQREVISILNQEHTQSKVADRLGVSQESISKMLHTAYYYPVKEALDSVKEYLKTI